MAISAGRVTRMGMAGDFWQPQGSYTNKVAGPVAPETPADPVAPALSGGSGGGVWRSRKDKLRRIQESDEELMELIKMAMPEIITYLMKTKN